MPNSCNTYIDNHHAELQEQKHNTVIQYGGSWILGIMKVWGFHPKNITKKPASYFLFNSLAILVRHSQAKKCLQINPNKLL